jgi:hypothetical protein
VKLIKIVITVEVIFAFQNRFHTCTYVKQTKKTLRRDFFPSKASIYILEIVEMEIKVDCTKKEGEVVGNNLKVSMLNVPSK